MVRKIKIEKMSTKTDFDLVMDPFRWFSFGAFLVILWGVFQPESYGGSSTIQLCQVSKSVVAKKHVSAAKRGAAAWSDSFVFVSSRLQRCCAPRSDVT